MIVKALKYSFLGSITLDRFVPNTNFSKVLFFDYERITRKPPSQKMGRKSSQKTGRHIISKVSDI
jgi:hypothetical protein